MYNKDWLYQKFNEENVEFIFFWKHDTENSLIVKTCLSQWAYSPFVVDNIRYYTAEHWMMAEKARLFKDDKILKEILSTKSAAEVQILGKKIRGFNISVWKEKRSEIVIEGNMHKFSQNNNMKDFLLSTENKILVEASPIDKIWGIGLSENDENANNPYLWKGENLLGFALMEVRDRLKRLKI
ncbi:MAG: NADAR family protein [Dysgonomonas sp.]|nr:NADAR family protein [Dysgonomonas sp.]